MVREIFGVAFAAVLGCGRVSFAPLGAASDPDAGAGATGDAIARRGCVAELSAYGDHVAVRRDDDALWCWGSNRFGQCGTGAVTPSRLDFPTPSLFTDAIALTSGEFSSCAIHRDRTLSCWGGNASGQLGDGTMMDRSVPASLPLQAGVAQAAMGQLHTCARLDDGTAWCWGDNGDGELGRPGVSQLSPVTSPSLVASPTITMTIGDAFTCAIRSGGGVECWGKNVNGELGNGSFASDFMPTAVGAPGPIRHLAGGCDSHACAVTVSGDVWCWGENTQGQIGIGIVTTAEPTPRQVPGITGAIDVAVGVDHTCALAADEVWCWGGNSTGEVGDGGFSQVLVPTRVGGLGSGLYDLQAGCNATFVHRADGTLVGWGASSSLGIGATANQPNPVEIAVPCT